MNFRETLKKHLDAIQRRSLQDLADAVAPDALSRSESDLTLVFEQHAGQWLMVQDQNTPIK